MKSPFSISIVVPVYNEANLVAQSLEQIVRFMRENFRACEILVIESGSTDGSGSLCDEAGQRFPEIRVVHEGARRGFGTALRLGFSLATCDVVALMTLDLPFPFESLVEAASLIDRYDCVLSYRSVDERRSAFRRVQSWVFNTALRRALGLRARHLNSALKMYRRELIQSLPLTSPGWFLDTEIIYWLERRGARSTEIAVPLLARRAGRSSTNLLTPLQILREAYRFAQARRDDPPAK